MTPRTVTRAVRLTDDHERELMAAALARLDGAAAPLRATGDA